jgi:high affinity sulfate transporter 1
MMTTLPARSTSKSPARSRGWLLPWKAGFQASWISGDLVAGIALGVVMIPQGMAYAELAGLPPVTGLYATMAAIIGYALLGSSRQLVVGPDSSTSTLVSAALLSIIGVSAAPEQFIAGAAFMAIVAGALLLLGAVLKAGVIANFLSKPVLVGYLNALALTIVIKQLPKILGYSVKAEEVIPAAIELIRNLSKTVPLSLAVGAGCLIIIYVFKRWIPKIPGALVAVVVATVVSALFDFQAQGLKVVGIVPSGLPSLSFPRVNLADFGLYLIPAFAIALMGFADTAVASELFADRNKYEVDADRDLYGLGAASLLSGLFGGFAVSASDSRTAVADNAGGKSQIANLIGAGVIALVLLFFAAVLRPLPTAALGAVVISAGITLFDFKTFQRAWQQQRSDFWIGMVAFAGAVILGLLPGIVIAVLLSLWNVLMAGAKTDLVVLSRSDVGNVWRNIKRQPEGYLIPGLTIVRWESGLFFGNSKGFARQVKELVAQTEPKPAWVVFDAEATGDADFTATTMLLELIDTLAQQGVVFGVAEPNGHFQDTLQRAGITAKIGAKRIFPSVDSAVHAYLAEHPSAMAHRGTAAAPGTPPSPGTAAAKA